MSNTIDKSVPNKGVVTIKRLSRTKWLFMLCWIQYTIIYWSCIILNRLPFFIYITPYVFPVLLVIAIYAWLRATAYKIDIWNLLVLFGAMTFWYVSEKMHPEYQQYFDENVQRCFQAFLMIYVGKSVFRGGFHEEEYEWLVKLSKIGVVFTSLYFIYGVLSGRVADSEYMTISYRMLPSTLCITSDFLRRIKVKNTVWFIGSFLFQMFMGTRGAVLAIAVYILLYLFLFAKRKTFHAAAVIGSVFICLDVFFDITTLLLEGLSSICASLHMSTRIIDAILYANLSDDNGREEIYTFVIQRIQDNVWFGDGIFADRYILQGMFQGGFYVHNILIELWTHFGLIPAIVIIGSIIILLLKYMKDTHLTQEARLLLGIGGIAALIQLMFTGSYLTDRPFWLMIGMIWGFKKYRKRIESI